MGRVGQNVFGHVFMLKHQILCGGAKQNGNFKLFRNFYNFIFEKKKDVCTLYINFDMAYAN